MKTPKFFVESITQNPWNPKRWDALVATPKGIFKGSAAPSEDDIQFYDKYYGQGIAVVNAFKKYGYAMEKEVYDHELWTKNHGYKSTKKARNKTREEYYYWYKWQKLMDEIIMDLEDGAQYNVDFDIQFFIRKMVCFFTEFNPDVIYLIN